MEQPSKLEPMSTSALRTPSCRSPTSRTWTTPLGSCVRRRCRDTSASRTSRTSDRTMSSSMTHYSYAHTFLCWELFLLCLISSGILAQGSWHWTHDCSGLVVTMPDCSVRGPWTGATDSTVFFNEKHCDVQLGPLDTGGYTLYCCSSQVNSAFHPLMDGKRVSFWNSLADYVRDLAVECNGF